MESKDETPSKDEQGSFWRQCRVCNASNAHSPGFKSFISLINHLLKHQAAKENQPISLSFDERTGNLMDSPAAEEKPGFKSKISTNQKAVLSVISLWLQSALWDLDYPSVKSGPANEQLVELVKRIPAECNDQRNYLLRFPDLVKSLAADQDWPRTSGFQAKFVADSMAGAQWGIQPSTSREYIRQAKKENLAIPALVRWGLEDWFRELAANSDQMK